MSNMNVERLRAQIAERHRPRDWDAERRAKRLVWIGQLYRRPELDQEKGVIRSTEPPRLGLSDRRLAAE